MKTSLSSINAPRPAGHYSQGIDTGSLVFTAGFGPQDPVTGAIADDVDGQTRQVLHNVAAVLAERGLTLDDCVKVTVHLANCRDVDEFNDVYKLFFSPPLPVRTTVGSELNGILVEMDVIASSSVSGKGGESVAKGS